MIRSTIIAGYPSFITFKDVKGTTHTYTTESGRVYHFANFEEYRNFRRFWDF